MLKRIIGRQRSGRFIRFFLVALVLLWLFFSLRPQSSLRDTDGLVKSFPRAQRVLSVPVSSTTTTSGGYPTVSEEPHPEKVSETSIASSRAEERPAHLSSNDVVPTVVPTMVKIDKSTGSIDVERRDAVLQAIRHSWNGYRKHAFGMDEFSPVSRLSQNWAGGKGIGVTIIDALDTLMIAGLNDEANEAIVWIRDNLDFNQNIKVSVFETTIRVLGGLLSAYQRSGNETLKEKALDIGRRLLPAFDTSSGIPDNYINLHSGHHEGAAWNGGAAILSELGSLQLEFKTLSSISGDPKYERAANKALDVISPHCSGLCPRNFHHGRPSGGSAGLGSFGDSFYEYLLKFWILTGKSDSRSKSMWDAAANRILRTSRTSGKIFVPNGDETGMTMEHLACFSGGLFALSFLETRNGEHLQAAEKIANTCHEMYVQQKTKLAPDVVSVVGDGRLVISEAKYILRPETVETYFYLWRVTHDKKYRDWGFEVLEACNKHLKVENGYVGTVDVRQIPITPNDMLETFWLAETLKYLYLLFSDDSALDLQSWVINTEAHPLKILKR